MTAQDQATLHELQARYRPINGTKYNNKELIAEYIRTLDPRVENMVILYLNTQLCVLGVDTYTMYQPHQVTVPLRQIVHNGIDCGAANIAFAHNHPSGSPALSEQDYHMYKSIVPLFELLDLKVIDFLVVTDDEAVSILDHPEPR